MTKEEITLRIQQLEAENQRLSAEKDAILEPHKNVIQHNSLLDELSDKTDGIYQQMIANNLEIKNLGQKLANLDFQ